VVRGSDYELTELGSFSDPDSILSRAAEVVAPVDDLVDYARSLI